MEPEQRQTAFNVLRRYMEESYIICEGKDGRGNKEEVVVVYTYHSILCKSFKAFVKQN